MATRQPLLSSIISKMHVFVLKNVFINVRAGWGGGDAVGVECISRWGEKRGGVRWRVCPLFPVDAVEGCGEWLSE